MGPLSLVKIIKTLIHLSNTSLSESSDYLSLDKMYYCLQFEKQGFLVIWHQHVELMVDRATGMSSV